MRACRANSMPEPPGLMKSVPLRAFGSVAATRCIAISTTALAGL